MMRPMRTFSAITFSIAILLAIAIEGYFSIGLLLSWLIAITFVTFLVYGYDKAIAGSDQMRVPERVLLALTFAGGTIGAVVGRSFFRHKTLKTSFRIQLWLIVLLQIILVLVYILWIDPRSLRVE